MNVKKFVRSLLALTAVFSIMLGLSLQPAAADISRACIGSTHYVPTSRTIMSTVVITQSTTSEVSSMGAYPCVDVQYFVTIGATTVNTTTLTLVHSNANVFVVGTTLGSDLTASGSAMTATYNIGRYTAISVTLANNNPVTITAVGWFR